MRARALAKSRFGAAKEPMCAKASSAFPRPKTSYNSPTRSWIHLPMRSEEHTSELQSLMRISYAVFCLKKNNHSQNHCTTHHSTTSSAHTHPHQLHYYTTT